jgi:NAD(P)-dependent dehydrogenase (short-subunit alcohol dehydrogenase family)
MRPKLKDQVIVITGASSGIGRACARAFAAAGGRVALAARTEKSLQEAAKECEAAGGQAFIVPTDVTDEHAVRALARRVVERFGRIDVWVNDAGVILYGRFEDTPLEAYRQVIETNLFGQMHGARAVLPHFRKQGSGVLINIASMWGKVSSPYVGAYVTSKFGIRGFSACLREELAGARHIHICTILPISVDTPIFHHGANYTGRKIRPVPPVVEPNRVVRAIMHAARFPRAEIMVGQYGHLLTLANTLFPWVFEFMVPYVFSWSTFGSQSDGRSPGNLFEPMPEWNRLSGNWRRGRKTLLRRAGLAGGATVAAACACWLFIRRRR